MSIEPGKWPVGYGFEIRVQRSVKEKTIEDMNLFIAPNDELLSNYVPIEEELRNRLINFNITLDEELSVLTFTIDNEDNFFRNKNHANRFKKYFLPGTHYIARFSVGEDVSPWISFRSIGSRGYDQFVITCYETFMYLMNLQNPIPPRKNGWLLTDLVEYIINGGKESEASIRISNESIKSVRRDYQGLVVKKKKAKDGTLYRSSVVNPMLNDEEISMPLQKPHGVTDLGYLKELANRIGYLFWIEIEEQPNGKTEGVINMRPRDFWQSPEYLLIYKQDFYDIHLKEGEPPIPYGGHILSINEKETSIDAAALTTFITGKGVDPVTGKIITFTSDINDKRFPATGSLFYDGYRMKNIYQGRFKSPYSTQGMYYSTGDATKKDLTLQKNRSKEKIRMLENEMHLKMNQANNKNVKKKIKSTYAKRIEKEKTKGKEILHKMRNGMTKKNQDIIDGAKKIILPSSMKKEEWVLQATGKIFKELEFTSKLNIKVIPNPHLKARSSLLVRGTHFYDGKWYIRQSSFAMSSSGLVQTLSLTRNSLFEEELLKDKTFTQGYILKEGSRYDSNELNITTSKLSINNSLNNKKKGGLKYKKNQKLLISNVKEKLDKSLGDYEYSQTKNGLYNSYRVRLSGGEIEINKIIANSDAESTYIKSLRKRGLREKLSKE